MRQQHTRNITFAEHLVSSAEARAASLAFEIVSQASTRQSTVTSRRSTISKTSRHTKDSTNSSHSALLAAEAAAAAKHAVYEREIAKRDAELRILQAEQRAADLEKKASTFAASESDCTDAANPIPSAVNNHHLSHTDAPSQTTELNRAIQETNVKPKVIEFDRTVPDLRFEKLTTAPSADVSSHHVLDSTASPRQFKPEVVEFNRATPEDLRELRELREINHSAVCRRILVPHSGQHYQPSSRTPRSPKPTKM